MHESYSEWLRKAVPSEATWRTKLSELRRIEAVYGDVDALCDQDELQTLIEELSYSSEDQRRDRPNPSKLKIDGDLRNNLSSYKSAAQKYARFRQDVEIEVTRSEVVDFFSGVNADVVETDHTFSMEKDLQSALRKEIEQLEPGLVIADGGVERTVPSGRIDILAKDQTGAWVVIELKAVKAPRDAVAQLLAYMGDMVEESDNPVRGILTAPDFDARALSAVRVVPNVRLMKYGFRFSFSAVEGR